MTETYGFFDSGVGGLTVLGAVQDRLPNLSFHYFGDTAHCPYGDRPLSEVRGFAIDAVDFLVDRGCDRIIMACNISSSVALADARDAYPDHSIHGLINESLVEHVANTTESGTVGVLATTGTVRSDRYRTALETKGLDVKQQACSPLVPLIESGQLEGETVVNTLEPLLKPMVQSDVDTVILGCTHYPFLAPVMSRLLDTSTTLVDPGKVLADHLFSTAPGTNGSKPVQQFHASGETSSISHTLEQIMKWPVDTIHEVDPQGSRSS